MCVRVLVDIFLLHFLPLVLSLLDEIPDFVVDPLTKLPHKSSLVSAQATPLSCPKTLAHTAEELKKFSSVLRAERMTFFRCVHRRMYVVDEAEYIRPAGMDVCAVRDISATVQWCVLGVGVHELWRLDWHFGLWRAKPITSGR